MFDFRGKTDELAELSADTDFIDEWAKFTNLQTYRKSTKVLKKYKLVSNNQCLQTHTKFGHHKLIGTGNTKKASVAGAHVETNTYHEPIRCNGKYRGKMNNNILELFYNGTEQNCGTDYSNFNIKNEGNKFYIQGLGGEGTFNVWLELKKTQQKELSKIPKRVYEKSK